MGNSHGSLEHAAGTCVLSALRLLHAQLGWYQGTLTAAERAELARLREETDRFVLRRSYALALLKWRGHTVPTVP